MMPEGAQDERGFCGKSVNPWSLLNEDDGREVGREKIFSG